MTLRARDIRQTFLDFFAGHGHAAVASGPLVPADDPTLFFTNAGMVQFKGLFLGEERRDYVRATTAQPCLRVAGKHNDLEEVGRTPRHHTLFEMLGNFSFGDYFKADAIALAWELLTRKFGIPADRLVATVYEKDDEAEQLWTRFLPRERIFRFGEKDNFWAMGDTGPCGPCSELHFDWTPTTTPPTRADVESGRFWEVWNLVFMQFNRSADGTMTPLAKPSIDTGMGLERLCAVLQGKRSNYETDLFAPLIARIEQVTGRSYTQGDAPHDVSIRVIADHIRATAFLIAGGVLPSNEGRGYVLRRIMRRAIRHGRMLGRREAFFAEILPALIEEMGGAYPELPQHRAFIDEVMRNEEARFLATLENGLAILNEAFTELAQQQSQLLPGAVAFKLYDTFGFPKDLTEDIAKEHGVAIDHAGFEVCMERQRAQARVHWKGSGAGTLADAYRVLQQQGVRSVFRGYTDDVATGQIVTLLRDGVAVAEARVGDAVEVVTDRSPFYAEQGGQIGDTGTLFGPDGEVEISDTQRPYAGIIVHRGRVVQGHVHASDAVRLVIDAERRNQIRKHHTATHLLHQALRAALGEHVKQAGSLVAPDRLRFDFAHFAPLTADQITEIEREANRIIQENITLAIREEPKQVALARGAMAFFGEKYGDVVRVVEVPGYSIELCGGTHARATGDIGAVKVVSEGSVGAGVRRIEAVCGRALIAYLQSLEGEQRDLAGLLKVGPQEVTGKVRKLLEQVKEMERELRAARQRTATGAAQGDNAVRVVNGVKVMARVVPDVDPKTLRTLGDQYKQQLGSGIVALATVRDGKASVVVMVTKDLCDRYPAPQLIQPLVAALGGTGGGRPDLAQGGGTQVEALVSALANFFSAGQ
ncbi:MAG: alanine--tRNA ligase [Deltaproteobacteria bacterium]|nr:alanine--tRNA ligase [Deltaproteobacteria bacterium]